MLLSMAILLQTAGHAQEPEQFTVATINIDGLPPKILLFKVNADGPGADGSSRIGKYINKKGYDIVCMQEDFNFHDVIVPWLEDDYQVEGDGRRIDYDVKDAHIDLRYPQHIKFPTDGLACACKNGIMLTGSERVAWNRSFGKFSHSFDDIVTKGFRRHELTLPSGQAIIVYNMHMDASSRADEEAGRDSMDRVAREAQWVQLRDDVLAHLDNRPVVVAGDMNSLYMRDRVKSVFIDAIEASGKGTVTDAWIQTNGKGRYPEYTGGRISTGDSNIIGDEMLDKIILINPTDGDQLLLTDCHLDTTDYLHNGRALGDHYPLVATFAVNRAKTAIGEVEAEAGETATYYNMKGARISHPSGGLYIERRGSNTLKKMK